MLWAGIDAAGSTFRVTATLSAVMPDWIRHPASPSPWADKTLLAVQTRVGWIPAQGQYDGIWDRP
ncbi:hypothetical protein [Agrobacterium sp.]|uniref:hypothetical protein n=1 Tax=Agrobacterium sp. TaxID=361 RepID=UPI004037E82D